MRKVVLLGGSGFIGRKLAAALSPDCFVIAADRVSCEEFSEKSNITFVPFDFTAKDPDFSFLEDADTVVHLISTLFPDDGTDQMLLDIENNLCSTVKLLEKMRTCHGELVFISSGGTVYGEGGDHPSTENDPLTAMCRYALTKIMIEETIKMYGFQNELPYKILRLSNPYGFNANSDRMQGAIPIFINKIIHGETITIWGNGNNERDYIYLDDAVDAIAKMVQAPQIHGIYNVAAGKSYSTLEVIQKIKDHIGDYPVIIEKTAPRKCDVRCSRMSVEKIKAAISWEPRHSLDDGIQEVVQEYVKRGYM